MKKFLCLGISLVFLFSGSCLNNISAMRPDKSSKNQNVSLNLSSSELRASAKQILLNCEHTLDAQRELFVVQRETMDFPNMGKVLLCYPKFGRIDPYKTIFMINRSNRSC